MKRNKKILITLGGIVLLAGVYFLILKTAPKNAGYFPFLLILLGLDLFLWRSIQKLLKKSPTFIRASFATLYWSPAVILFLSLLATLLCKRYNPSSHAVIYLMGFVFTMYVSKLVPGLVDLISALIRFLIRIISRIFRLGDVNTEVINRGFRPVHLAGYGTGLAMLVLLVLGMAWWGYDFRIVEHNLSIPDLPEAFRGCRIVQISDLHLGTWPSKSKLEEVVSDVNELSPDLILFTGDMVNSRSSEMAPYESILKKARAMIGIYAVLGNHDYGDYATWDSPEEKDHNLRELYDYFDRIGWNLLGNKNEIINIDGDSIALVGVDNWSIYDRFDKKGDLAKAMKGLPDSLTILLMTHDPSHWEKEVITGYPDIDLTLTGHTHGFQFGIETNQVKWSPVQWLYDEWAGMYEYSQSDGRKQYLYVNRGLGAIGYPGRVGIRPEITLIVLN